MRRNHNARNEEEIQLQSDEVEVELQRSESVYELIDEENMVEFRDDSDENDDDTGYMCIAENKD